MEKAYEILKHIEELYSKENVTDEIIRKQLDKNPEVVNAWREAFELYDLTDVFKAIDEFWRYANNKSKPRVAQLLSMLNTTKEVEKAKPQEKQPSVRFFCIESDLMRRDIELGKNTDCLLSDYRRAVNYILTDRLIETLGSYEYNKLSNDDKTKERSDKYRIAMQNGLFNDFDDILRGMK